MKTVSCQSYSYFLCASYSFFGSQVFQLVNKHYKGLALTTTILLVVVSQKQPLATETEIVHTKSLDH